MITARHCCCGYIDITASAVAPPENCEVSKRESFTFAGEEDLCLNRLPNIVVSPSTLLLPPLLRKSVLHRKCTDKNFPVTNFTSCSWMQPGCFHTAMAQNAPTYVSDGCLQRQGGRTLSLVASFPHQGCFRYLFNSS